MVAMAADRAHRVGQPVGHRAPACATGRYRAGELIHTTGVTNPDFEIHAHDRIRVGEVTALFGRCAIASVRCADRVNRLIRVSPEG
jgi:hypothetical protein